jgi:hypothetical protein
MFAQDSAAQALMDRMNNAAPLEGMGTVLNRTKNHMVAVYDFAVLGGAVSTINLVDEQGNLAILPKGAIVTNVIAHVVTAVLSSGTTGVSLGLLTATDLMASTVKGSLLINTLVAGAPVGSAATCVGPVTAAAGSQVTVGIITTALTAGKIYYHIEYMISGVA